jgi:hypothetical protein
MTKVTVTHVENGYIIEYTKVDVLNNRPETTVVIQPDIDGVITYLREQRV